MWACCFYTLPNNDAIAKTHLRGVCGNVCMKLYFSNPFGIDEVLVVLGLWEWLDYGLDDRAVLLPRRLNIQPASA